MSINLVVYNGLCNRLIPLISCYRIAKLYNKHLNILWNGPPVRSCINYTDNKPCLFEDIFEKLEGVSIVNQEEFEKLTIKSDKVYKFHYENCKKLVIEPEKYENICIYLALYPILLQTDNIKDYIEFTLDSEKSSDGLFQNEIFKQLKISFNCLKPIKEVQQIIDNVYEKFSKNMIGLHIRKTDGGFTHMNWNEIDKVLISKLKHWVKQNLDNKIFLATDCKKTQNKYKFYFNNRIIFYNPKQTKFDNNHFNVICGVVDLFLLSKCNIAIIGTLASSFSLTSGLLSNIPLWLVKNEKSPIPI